MLRSLDRKEHHFNEGRRFIVFFEPTDRRKAIKALSSNYHIKYSSPNITELRAMANFLQPNNNIKESNDLEEIVTLAKIVLKVIDILLVTRGSKGVVTIKAIKGNSSSLLSINKKFEVRLYTPEVLNTIENVSGAGDCFSSGFIYGLLIGLNESESISAGFSAAKEALLSKGTVPCSFNRFRYDKKIKYNTWSF